MEFFIDAIEWLVYIYEEVFWLKECFTTLKYLAVFFIVWLIMKVDYREELLLYLATFIGVACIFFGDIGYLSDNNVLKLIAPTSLFLLTYNKDRNNYFILFVFLIPYFITSYEFYRNFYTVLQSIISHTLIIFIIIMAKENLYLSLLISC